MTEQKLEYFPSVVGRGVKHKKVLLTIKTNGYWINKISEDIVYQQQKRGRRESEREMQKVSKLSFFMGFDFVGQL